MYKPSSKKSRRLTLKQKRRKKYLGFLLKGLSIFVLIFTGLGYASHQPGLSITEVLVDGNILSSSSEIAAAAKAELSGNYLGLFSKANDLLYPQENIKTEILKGHPEIKDVSVASGGLNGLKVIVDERKPSALWCGVAFVSATSSQCYLADENGYIFLREPANYSGDFLKYYSVLKSAEPVGQNILSATDFQFVMKFAKDVASLGFQTALAEKLPDGDIKLALKDCSQIFFNLSQDEEKLVVNLSTVISDKTLQISAGKGLLSAKTIDLRFGNKIFYKK